MKKSDFLRAISTAYDWHEGSWIYSFASCRKVVDERHRGMQLQTLEGDIAYCYAQGKKLEMKRLEHLKKVVENAPAGVELVTWEEYVDYDNRKARRTRPPSLVDRGLSPGHDAVQSR